MKLEHLQFLALQVVASLILVENNSLVSAFSSSNPYAFVRTTTTTTALNHAPMGTTVAGGFIETELRGAAMKLHTRSQAPKEGQAKEQKPKEKYVPTRDDYLAFLVDSKFKNLPT